MKGSPLDYDEIRSKIKQVFLDVFLEQFEEKDPPSVHDDMVLLESGMDSLGFAILVVRLEDELGFDPFTESDEVFYPETFKEFVVFYERNQIA